MVKLEKESLINKLDDQMQSLLNPKTLAFYGPESVGHLQSFSLTVNTPDVIDLIQQLGNCSKHDEDDGW